MVQQTQKLYDFSRHHLDYLIHRQVAFCAAVILIAVFLSPYIAIYLFFLAEIPEIFDVFLARSVLKRGEIETRKVKQIETFFLISAIASSLVLSTAFLYLLNAHNSVDQHASQFFLIISALFAALNYFYLSKVLIARISTYALAFMIVPLSGIWRSYPMVGGPQIFDFLLSLFVLILVGACCFAVFRFYNNSLTQIEKLKIANNQALAALEAKSQFLSTLSHELRTPLTSIKGSLDLVLSGRLGEMQPKIHNLIEIAGRNASRLTALIDEVLDMQKLENGELVFNISPVDLTQLVQKSIAANEHDADRQGISLRVSTTGDTFFVDGDFDRLMQVMTNVLSNAIKFSHKGGRVDVSLKKVGSKVRISVRDYGVGIPAGKQQTVFESFSQVDSSDTRKIGGTGLGMSLAKKIMDRHKGSIGYVSKVGEGTTFHIELNGSVAL